MEEAHRHLNSGLTLIEVMITLLIALVIAIGVISYMYATNINAHMADVRATATRLGLLLLEGWKTQSGETDPLIYDPKVDFDTNTLIPFTQFDEPKTIPDNPSGLTTTFKYYVITLDNTQYFVRMSYQNTANTQKELNVAVAWDRNSKDNKLDYSTTFLISQTKFATYVVEE